MPSRVRNSWLVCSALLISCLPEVPPTPASPDAATPTTMPDAAPTDSMPTPSVLAKFQDWQKCMTLGDFQAAAMTASWNNVVAQNNTRCETCHENGGDGFLLTRNETKFFDTMKTKPYYALQYFSPQVGDPFRVIANEVAMQGVSQGQDPHREHPRFEPEAGLAASRAFAALVQAKYEAGNCL